MNKDDYTQGRLNIIKELKVFLDKKIKEAIKAKQEADNNYKKAHLSGVMGAHNRCIKLLEKKLTRMAQKEGIDQFITRKNEKTITNPAYHKYLDDAGFYNNIE